jgi:hypothetical protein
VLGQERVEAVERADVKHPLAGEGQRQDRDAVAVVARDAGRVESVLAVERERVEPQRNALQRLSCGRRIGLDRQQVRDGPLGVRDDGERTSGNARHGTPRVVRFSSRV